MATPWEEFCTPSPEIAEAIQAIRRHDRTCDGCGQEFDSHAAMVSHRSGVATSRDPATGRFR